MKYKNLKVTIIISILLGLTSCNGEDDSKSEMLENSDDPSEENVLSIDQIKNSQEEFLVQEIENPDEKEPEVVEEPDEVEESDEDEDEDAPELEEEEVVEDEPTEDEAVEDEIK